MASSVLELLIRARDEASAVFDQAGNAGSKAASLIEQHWLKASVALTGAGVGLEALARKQQDQRISMEQLALRTGMTSEEINGLARSLANVGFPLADVTGLMELAARQGLDSATAISDYANFWDMVADATGGSAVELAKSGVALQSMGIAIGEEGAALDAFGFITRNTSMSVTDFLSFIERSAPELREMAVSVNDAAAMLAVMESQGIRGRKAISEFTTAANTADGNLAKMIETLGITQEQFAAAQAQVTGSSATIVEFAGVVDDSFTPLQTLQHELTEVGARFQGPILAAADFAPVLIAVGPAAKGVQLAISALPAVMGAFQVATTLAMGPVGLIAIGIAALVAVGILLWKNWDTISEAFTRIWGGIRDFAEGVFDRIRSLYESGFGWILPAGPLIKAIMFLADHWQSIWGGVRSTFETVVGFILNAKDRLVDGLTAAARVLAAPYIAAFNLIRSGINAVIAGLNAIPDISIPNWVPGIGGKTFGIPEVPQIPALPSFQTAPGEFKVVPGPRGAPQLGIVHGGEVVSSGLGSIQFIFNAPVVGVENLQEIVIDAIRTAARRGAVMPGMST